VSSIDVIIPCYRYAHFLTVCVDSVLAQSGPRVRTLIIDDASPDNTSEVAATLAADSRVTVLRHRSNAGHIATYNEGLAWAASDYLLILSADDYLLPGALKRAADLMDAYPEVAFAFGNAIQLEPSGAQRPINNVPGKADALVLPGARFIELSGARNIVPTPTAVVRTQLQQRVGGYRPELTHSGDMEMWLRLAAHGSVGMLREYQAVYRRHAGNMSLAYMADGFLPDMKQRKAAMEFFFESCGHLLPEVDQVKRRLYRALAGDAVKLGSTAFNASKMEASQTLCDFARATWPGISRSPEWAKLACKRRMGRGVWHVLQPAVRRWIG
jgi:glycosyltransferase involved in cell wall biosynthesis